eukprot:TRINITY_DN3122_c0_g1_i1.p1 TRINITY_DN3122_c0_g1~~TRINITY_DN3122_c0_g1_i1.p1  ORF type:complete len:181 (+),score=21.30 TRINITY_DN3122_c0_g1_i1:261-803(+)
MDTDYRNINTTLAQLQKLSDHRQDISTEPFKKVLTILEQISSEEVLLHLKREHVHDGPLYLKDIVTSSSTQSLVASANTTSRKNATPTSPMALNKYKDKEQRGFLFNDVLMLTVVSKKQTPKRKYEHVCTLPLSKVKNIAASQLQTQLWELKLSVSTGDNWNFTTSDLNWLLYLSKIQSC